MLEPTIDETILGEGNIIAEFKINKVRIAGAKITKGEFTIGDSVHLKRDGEIIKDTKVEGIHQGKNIIEKIKMGNECGITFKPYIDFHQNDAIIAYKK
jgi:translation initiation factor IF-2